MQILASWGQHHGWHLHLVTTSGRRIDGASNGAYVVRYGREGVAWRCVEDVSAWAQDERKVMARPNVVNEGARPRPQGEAACCSSGCSAVPRPANSTSPALQPQRCAARRVRQAVGGEAPFLTVLTVLKHPPGLSRLGMPACSPRVARLSPVSALPIPVISHTRAGWRCVINRTIREARASGLLSVTSYVQYKTVPRSRFRRDRGQLSTTSFPTARWSVLAFQSAKQGLDCRREAENADGKGRCRRCNVNIEAQRVRRDAGHKS